MHARRLRRIPIRIHVNGTRGKTSVTRLLAATLREAGVRTMAKVTGDEPLLILPDGTEHPVLRRGPARIQEQMWFVRQAARERAQAIVVECMALAPDLQRVSEERMIRSTIGVITNVRADHFEVMGDSHDAAAAALAGTIPRNGVLVTADRAHFERFARRSAELGSRAILATAAASGAEPAAPEQEHASIVREVCAQLGRPDAVPRAAARPALAWRIVAGQRRLLFINAFSANDPESTAVLQRSVAAAMTLPEPRVALLNNRADRPRRMLGFVDYLRTDNGFAAIALGGALTTMARRRLAGCGRPVWALRAIQPERIIQEIGERVGAGQFTVVGMGNAKGLGLDCARYCAEKGTPCH